jgi:hypothetical protein
MALICYKHELVNYHPHDSQKNPCNNHRILSDKFYGIVRKYVEETWGF